MIKRRIMNVQFSWIESDNRLVADDSPVVLSKHSAFSIAEVGNSKGEACQRPVCFAIK